MFKLRILSQALVVLFVFLSAGAKYGYGWTPPTALLLAATLATIWLASSRTTWLPFLGPTAMPVGILTTHVPRDSDMAVVLEAPKNAIRVMYWGSVSSADDPIAAYGGYTNGGIADVVNGKAKVTLLRPKAYAVAGKKLRPHVHYRWVSPRGLLSSVRTVFV